MSKYIDLNEAIDLFKGIDATMTGGWVADTLEALPTIEFNKEGEWYKKEIWENNDKGRVVPVEEWQSAKCSVCGRYHITPYEYYFDDFNYCPNCGAKMKG